jgi:hypothetical protein
MQPTLRSAVSLASFSKTSGNFHYSNHLTRKPIILTCINCLQQCNTFALSNWDYFTQLVAQKVAVWLRLMPAAADDGTPVKARFGMKVAGNAPKEGDNADKFKLNLPQDVTYVQLGLRSPPTGHNLTLKFVALQLAVLICQGSDQRDIMCSRAILSAVAQDSRSLIDSSLNHLIPSPSSASATHGRSGSADAAPSPPAPDMISLFLCLNLLETFASIRPTRTRPDDGYGSVLLGELDGMMQVVRRCCGVISGCEAAAQGRSGWQEKVEVAFDVRLSILRTIVNLCNNNPAVVDTVIDRRMYEPICSMLQQHGQVLLNGDDALERDQYDCLLCCLVCLSNCCEVSPVARDVISAFSVKGCSMLQFVCQLFLDCVGRSEAAADDQTSSDISVIGAYGAILLATFVLQHVNNQRALIQQMPGGSLQPIESTISQFLDYHAAASVGSKDTKKSLTKLLQEMSAIRRRCDCASV